MSYEIVVAIGGLHGTGKTTYAKKIAREFGLRHASAGQNFRRIAEEQGLNLYDFMSKAEEDSSIDYLIDEAIKREAERRSVVIDGQLAAHMASEKADLKIYLFAPDEVRFKRIADRDGVTVEEAQHITKNREIRERVRFRKIYRIDVRDLSIYNLIIDTSLKPLNETIKMLKNIVSDYIKQKNAR